MRYAHVWTQLRGRSCSNCPGIRGLPDERKQIIDTFFLPDIIMNFKCFGILKFKLKHIRNF